MDTLIAEHVFRVTRFFARTHRAPACLSLLVLLIVGNASAAIFRVGSGASCTHSTIQGAIDTAAANGPSLDVIRVATNLTYAQQALTIDGHALLIQGGFPDCAANAIPTPGVRTALLGGLGAAKPVLELRGAQGNLVLINMVLREGDQIGSANGGGLAISGSNHVVELIDVSIQGNRAGNGGGIAITGAVGSGNEIKLNDAVLISGNSASGNGGGIYCQNAKLTMVTSNGTIFSNSAVTSGGGIFADRCDIALANSGSIGALSGNSAVTGGGLYATNASLVELYSLSTLALTQIVGNTASGSGGGMYLTNDAQIKANEVVWANNRAFVGAVAYVYDDNPSGATELRLNDLPPTSANLLCEVGAVCSQWRGNQARNPDGSLVNGTQSAGVAVSSAGGRAVVLIHRVSIHGNQGGPILTSSASGGSTPTVLLQNSEIYGNSSLGSEAAGLMFGSYLSCNHLSIAGNTVNASALINGFNGPTTLRMIAANQPGRRLAAQAGTGVINGSFLIANDLTGIPPTVNNLQQDPLFVSATDLQLQALSPAIDYANTTISAADLTNGPRPVDLASVPNEFGAVDVGAYEMPQAATEAIFSNGFE